MAARTGKTAENAKTKSANHSHSEMSRLQFMCQKNRSSLRHFKDPERTARAERERVLSDEKLQNQFPITFYVLISEVK